MKDNERDQLHKLVDALEANLRDAARDIARLEGDLAAVAADRDALRASLRMVVDKGRRIPVSNEPGRTAGVAAHFQDGEWGAIVAATQGWQEGDAITPRGTTS